MALQSVAFVTAVLVIADGFLGHPMGAMNLAGVLPWTYVRAFGVIALLVLGNIFCLSCPFMLPRELGHRLGLARFKWPRWLRSKWIAIALMILFFWSYEAFAIWDHPAAHRLAADRVFRRGLPGRHLLSRRQLLQVSLPAGAIQFRRFAAFALHPAGAQPGHLRALHHPRLHRRKCSSSVAASCSSICRKRPETWTALCAWTASKPAPMTTSACSPLLRYAMCCAIRCDRRSAGSRRASTSPFSSWWW